MKTLRVPWCFGGGAYMGGPIRPDHWDEHVVAYEGRGLAVTRPRFPVSETDYLWRVTHTASGTKLGSSLNFKRKSDALKAMCAVEWLYDWTRPASRIARDLQRNEIGRLFGAVMREAGGAR